MRILIILIASLFVEKLCMAQFFNKRFVVENRPTLNVGVGALNDTLYVLGSAGVGPILENRLRGYIMKSDRSGNFVDSAFIYLPDKQQVAFYEGSTFVIDKNNNRIATTGYTWGGGGKALLYITNSNLDSLLLKEYGYPNSYRCFGHKLTKHPDGGFLIVGRMQFIGSVDVQVLLIRTDSLGNEIWKNTYGDLSLLDRGSDVIVLPNGNLLVGVHSEKTPDTGDKVYTQTYLIETDSLGNKVWEWRDPDTSTVLISMTPTQDGGFLGGGGYITYRSKPLGFRMRPYLVKFDSNKQKVWEKLIGAAQQQTWFNDVIELEDNTLLVCGSDIDTPAEQYNIVGSIRKLSAIGDVIWSRFYKGVDSKPQCCGRNVLYDLEVLPDGSIVATGQADDDTGINGDPSQQGWLLHVDSNGCLLPGSCGVTAIEVFPSWEGLGVGFVKVYPNPAHHLLNIQLQNFTHLPGSIQILNTGGQVVLQQNVQSDEMQLDVAALPQGLYVVQVRENNQVMQYKKFVKE